MDTAHPDRPADDGSDNANDNAKPRYQLIAEELISEITAGHIPVGAMLPTELELCARYEVSRHTVREALRRLRELGLVAMRRGSGTRVISDNPEPAYVQSVSGLSELLQYPETKFVVTDAGSITADERQTEILHCAPGRPWFRVRGVRRAAASNTPICWQEVYVLPEFEAAARLIDTEQLPVHTIIEQQHGEIIARASLTMFASHINATLARSLEVPAGTAAMTIVRRYRDQNGRLFETTVSTHPEGRFVYSLDLQRDWRTGE